jgi:hypothetical protein
VRIITETGLRIYQRTHAHEKRQCGFGQRCCLDTRF